MDGEAWKAAVHGSWRVGHNWTTSFSLFTFMHWRRKWQPTPILLPGKSHGWRSLEGYSPWVAEGRTWLSNLTFTFHFHALEKEMATLTSVLAWRIPGTREPNRLPSMGSHRVGHNWSDLAATYGHIQLTDLLQAILHCEAFIAWHLTSNDRKRSAINKTSLRYNQAVSEMKI